MRLALPAIALLSLTGCYPNVLGIPIPGEHVQRYQIEPIRVDPIHVRIDARVRDAAVRPGSPAWP